MCVCLCVLQSVYVSFTVGGMRHKRLVNLRHDIISTKLSKKKKETKRNEDVSFLPYFNAW